MYGEVEVPLHAFSFMALGGGEHLTSHSGHLTLVTQLGGHRGTHLLLDPLKQQHDGVHDSGCKVCVLGLGVAAPAADLSKHKLHKDWQRALPNCVAHKTPLVVGEVTACCLHPHPVHRKITCG